ncbi:hypothetical protein AGR5A_Cc70015 [Agrobacterium genomosp. 5 str. CFBP 6626]|nr:hypothetical protein AGR5A_Cc70015 [Agrobacterium genomosp. 5 str. CFBP 6626]
MRSAISYATGTWPRSPDAGNPSPAHRPVNTKARHISDPEHRVDGALLSCLTIRTLVCHRPLRVYQYALR